MVGYTLETLIQAGDAGLAIENVAVRTNPKVRESRLFKSTADYLRKNGVVIFRSCAMFRPLQTFGRVALVLLAIGLLLMARFMYYYISDPGYSGHVQSLVVGVGAMILSFITAMLAMLGDLAAANRRLIEEVLMRVRRVECSVHALPEWSDDSPLEGIYTTSAAPWQCQPVSEMNSQSSMV